MDLIQLELRNGTTGVPALLRNKAFALYQGTTSVVPSPAKMVRALAPAIVNLHEAPMGKAQGLKPLSLLARLCGTT
jgi:hypothetical protein